MKLLHFFFLSLLLTLLSCSVEQQNPTSFSEDVISNRSKDKSDITLSSTMSVAPYRIVLNAKGSFDDIQCSFPGTMPAGYSIYSFDLELFFNNNLVAEAESFTYCYIDNIYFAGFDRTELQNNDYVQNMPEGEAEAMMTGTYTLSNSDNETITYEITKYDVVYIKKPGR
jgi:hypothetical protein